MSDVAETVGKVAEKMVEETGKNASSPQWTLNVLALALVGFVLLAAGGIPAVWFVYIGKPSAEAQNEAVKASTEAIRSNAESNRKMGEAIVTISKSVEDINTNFDKSARRMSDVVSDLQKIEQRQDETLKTIADKLHTPPPNGG